jgi:hypothetical protein
MHLQVYIDTTDKDVVKVPLSEEEQVLPIPRRPQWVGLRYLAIFPQKSLSHEMYWLILGHKLIDLGLKKSRTHDFRILYIFLQIGKAINLILPVAANHICIGHFSLRRRRVLSPTVRRGGWLTKSSNLHAVNII